MVYPVRLRGTVVLKRHHRNISSLSVPWNQNPKLARSKYLRLLTPPFPYHSRRSKTREVHNGLPTDTASEIC